MDLQLLNHICKLQSELYNIPFLIYENIFYIESIENAPVDIRLIAPFIASLENIDSNINYLLLPDLIVIGYIKDNASNKKIIIGPVSINSLSDDNIINLISSNNNILKSDDFESIKKHFSSLSKFSLSRFLHILCIMNGYINNEITTTDDLSRKGFTKDFTMDARLKLVELDKSYVFDEKEISNNYAFESEIMFYISHGMTDQLHNLFTYSSNFGNLGPTSLRHYKNACIILNAISLRSAIIGGLNPETAYQLGEIYVQQIEACNTIESLSSIASNIVNDYCNRVKLIHKPITNHSLINKTIKYISDNYQNRLTVEEIALEVGMSKEYLSSKFKSVVGINVPTYINNQKIQKAKQLLALSSMPLSEIAELLSFSSQSYFQSIFKKTTGATPLEYRSKKSLVRDL